MCAGRAERALVRRRLQRSSHSQSSTESGCASHTGQLHGRCSGQRLLLGASSARMSAVASVGAAALSDCCLLPLTLHCGRRSLRWRHVDLVLFSEEGSLPLCEVSGDALAGCSFGSSVVVLLAWVNVSTRQIGKACRFLTCMLDLNAAVVLCV